MGIGEIIFNGLASSVVFFINIFNAVTKNKKNSPKIKMGGTITGITESFLENDLNKLITKNSENKTRNIFEYLLAQIVAKLALMNSFSESLVFIIMIV